MKLDQTAIEIICSDYISIVPLNNELWMKYISGDVHTGLEFAEGKYGMEYEEYYFTILCLIHCMEGGCLE